MDTLYETPLTPELAIRDISVSLPFYTGVLGFEIQYERPENGFAMLVRQGARLMLDQMNTGDRTWFAGPIEVPFGRGVNFQIETTDVDALYEKVLESGAEVFLPIEERWYRADDVYLGNRQFIVLDPDGYLLRFYEDLGEKKS